jgi:molybdopterin-guanine dinucleotide biosynthesis protein B
MHDEHASPQWTDGERGVSEHAKEGIRAAGDSALPPALVAIVGKSDSGKTTLIEKLIPELLGIGLRVGAVKHRSHGFDIDHPGKDSWRHGQAGAQAYAVASPDRLAFVTKLDEELPLTTIARRFFGGFDLVVAEGYKYAAPHRVELFRLAAGHTTPLCGPGESLAVITDAPIEHEHLFALDDARGLAQFLAARLDTLRQY